jgi:hypothetical protein
MFKRGIVLTLFVVLLFGPLPALAGIGISPGSLGFESMLRGGYYERYVTVSNPQDDDVVVSVGAEGQVAKWFTTEPNNFNLTGKSFRLVKIIVQPPSDMPNGVYSGTILVAAKPAALEQMGSTGAVAISAVLIDATVTITDVEVLQLNVEGASVQNTEECRPILVSIGLRNTGNVRVTPTVRMEVRTTDTNKVMQTADGTGELVLPTKTSSFNFRIPAKTPEFVCLPIGGYIAETKVYGNGQFVGSSQMPFNVFPRGTLSLAGELLQLDASPNITLGEMVKVDGLFKNTGQLPAMSKLVLEVSQGGNLVGNMAGDEREVNIGGIEKLTAFYRPGSPGRYRITGYVSYEGKLTDRKDVDVEVRWPMSYLLGGAAIVLGIVVALIVLSRRRAPQAKGRK